MRFFLVTVFFPLLLECSAEIILLIMSSSYSTYHTLKAGFHQQWSQSWSHNQKKSIIWYYWIQFDEVKIILNSLIFCLWLGHWIISNAVLSGTRKNEFKMLTFWFFCFRFCGACNSTYNSIFLVGCKHFSRLQLSRLFSENLNLNC